LIADGGHRGADEFDEPAHSDFGMLHDTQITRPKQAGLRLPDYKNLASGVAIGDRAALWLKEAAAPGSWPLQLEIPNPGR
jgi:hypothetical protein